MSHWDWTEPLPSAGDIQPEGSKLGDKVQWAERGQGAETERDAFVISARGVFHFLKILQHMSHRRKLPRGMNKNELGVLQLILPLIVRAEIII